MLATLVPVTSQPSVVPHVVEHVLVGDARHAVVHEEARVVRHREVDDS